MTPRQQIVVRRAHSMDLDAVVGVHAAHDPNERGTGPPSVREIATWARIVRTPDLTVYLAEIEGRPVGTASMLLMPNLTYDCAPTAFIEAVVVIPAHRRQGVATTIIRQLLDDAQEAGCDKVQLVSHKRHASDGAHDLYRGLGFEPEAEGFRLYLRENRASETVR